MCVDRQNCRDVVGAPWTVDGQDTAGTRSADRTRVPQLAPTVYRPANSVPSISSCSC